MNKKDLRKIIKECIREILDTDTFDGANSMSQFHKEMDITNLDSFTESYITAALWSSTTGLEDSGGDPLDKNYTIDDIDHNTLLRMIRDCKDFQEKYEELYTDGGWDDEQAAHDFWLSRNGHGSGFTDRGYDYDAEEIGERLQSAAKSYGTYDLYLGDGSSDGILFGYPPN
jgi:hypothetical protein